MKRHEIGAPVAAHVQSLDPVHERRGEERNLGAESPRGRLRQHLEIGRVVSIRPRAPATWSVVADDGDVLSPIARDIGNLESVHAGADGMRDRGTERAVAKLWIHTQHVIATGNEVDQRVAGDVADLDLGCALCSDGGDGKAETCVSSHFDSSAADDDIVAAIAV